MNVCDILLSKGVSASSRPVLPLYFVNWNCNIKLRKFTNFKTPYLKLPYSTTALYNRSCVKSTPLKIAIIKCSHARSKSEFKDIHTYLNLKMDSCQYRANHRPASFIRTIATSNSNILIQNIPIPLNLEVKPISKHSGSQMTDDPYMLNSQWSKIIYLPFQCYIKPVSLSSDYIQIKNSECQNKTVIRENLDARYPLFFDRMYQRQTVSNKEFTGGRIVRNDAILSFETQNHFPRSTDPYTLRCSSSNAVSPTGSDTPKELGKPPNEQLTKVFHTLSKDLPALFYKSPNYTVYSQDIIFENRINGTCTVGLPSYIRQVMMLRLVGHIKFAYVQFQILKITRHPEDSTVRVRWRIVGLSAFKSLPIIFTWKKYSFKDNEDKMDKWYDGFSIFHVGEDGRVLKHVADKMMPNEELGIVKKPSMANRLAALVGLAPKNPAPSGAAVSSSIKDKTDEGIIKFFGVSSSAYENVARVV